MKFARDTLIVAYSGGKVVLVSGESIDDEHPLVLERPELFADELPEAKHRVAPAVETATRGPGEARRGRPRKATGE